MYFDGTSNQNRFGVGILLIAAEGLDTLIFVKLNFRVTNNVVVYEAYIIELQASIKEGMKNIRVILI